MGWICKPGCTGCYRFRGQDQGEADLCNGVPKDTGPTTTPNYLNEKLTAVGDAIRDIPSSAGDMLEKGEQVIANGISNATDYLEEGGKNIWAGITNATDSLENGVKGGMEKTRKFIEQVEYVAKLIVTIFEVIAAVVAIVLVILFLVWIIKWARCCYTSYKKCLPKERENDDV